MAIFQWLAKEPKRAPLIAMSWIYPKGPNVRTKFLITKSARLGILLWLILPLLGWTKFVFSKWKEKNNFIKYFTFIKEWYSFYREMIHTFLEKSVPTHTIFNSMTFIKNVWCNSNLRQICSRRNWTNQTFHNKVMPEST